MSEVIESILDQSRLGFEKIASAHNLVRWAEESQFAVQAIRRNSRLGECNRESVQDAIINVAAVGLTLNPAHGYAYLVPESIKVGDDWVQVCQLRISFKGLVKVATDSGVINWVAADVVHKNDDFTFRGKWELPVHNMDPFSTERGEPVGVYCVARMHDGQFITETAPWSEVQKAKAAAKTHTVWDKWEGEMAKKFIIKRASKQWPKSDRLSTTVGVINEYEGSQEFVDKIEAVANFMVEHIAADDKAAVLEAYEELDEHEQRALFVAKTKGGYLTQAEKRFIRDVRQEWWEARKENEIVEIPALETPDED